MTAPVWCGWSVNLSDPSPAYNFEVHLPVPPIMRTTAGEVAEVVFWSEVASRWIHIVSAPFERELPAGHVQVTAGDLAWLEQVVARSGLDGLKACVAELETCMVARLDA